MYSSESTLSFQEVEKVELNAARMTVSNALNYLNSVKVAFGANSEEYLDFIELLKDFKELRFGNNLSLKKNLIFLWDLF